MPKAQRLDVENMVSDLFKKYLTDGTLTFDFPSNFSWEQRIATLRVTLDLVKSHEIVRQPPMQVREL